VGLWGAPRSSFPGGKLAERGGFEPPVPLPVHHLSKVTQSATLPPLRRTAQKTLAVNPEAKAEATFSGGCRQGFRCGGVAILAVAYCMLIMASLRNPAPGPHGRGAGGRTEVPACFHLVCAAAGAAVLVKFLLAAVIPATADECLHWLQGQHLALGFRDHPPATAMLSRVATDVFGANWFGLRIVAILSTLACSGIVWAILRELGADRHRAMMAAAAVQLLPMLGFGVLMVPVMPHLALVLGAEWALLRASRRDRLRDHVLFGLLLGLAMMTYYLAAVLVLVAMVAVVCERRVWLRPGMLLGLVVAALVFTPNLYWNLLGGAYSAMHFQLVDRSRKAFAPWQLLAYPLLALGLAGPLLVPALRRTPWALTGQSTGEQDWRAFFAWMVVGVLVLFTLIATVTQAGGHWAVLAYLNLPLVLLAPAAEPLSPRWWRAAVVAWAIPAAVVVAVAAVGLPRVSAWLPAASAASRARALNAEDATAQVLRVVEQVRADGLQPVVAADRWSMAGMLSFHGAGRLQATAWPPPTRHGRDFWDWQAGSPVVGELVYVSSAAEPPAAVRAACAGLELLSVLGQQSPYLWIYRCRDFRPPQSSSR